MDTIQKLTPPPTQIIEPLTFKNKSPPLYPPPPQISILSKINTPPPAKKVKFPNLHDLERFQKKLCMFSKYFTIFCLYENVFSKSTKLNINSFLLPLSLHCTAKVLEATRIVIKYQLCVKTNSCVFNCKLDNKNINPENV